MEEESDRFIVQLVLQQVAVVIHIPALTGNGHPLKKKKMKRLSNIHTKQFSEPFKTLECKRAVRTHCSRLKIECRSKECCTFLSLVLTSP